MGERGAKLQAEMMDVMRSGTGPFAAYDLLNELRAIYPKIAPPTVYRALTALMERGQVHRIESMNAFVPCQCSEHNLPSIMSICDDCGSVEENVEPAVFSKLNLALGKTGFSAHRHVIEVHGTCASCGPGQAST